MLRQTAPLDSLERINRRVGEQAVEFFDSLPTPSAKATCWCFRTTRKECVLLVRQDAVVLRDVGQFDHSRLVVAAGRFVGNGLTFYDSTSADATARCSAADR